MRTHALPSDETARIDALMRARILDSPPETAFDDLVQLAASLCDAPLAVITFIDRDRQWFKARVGVEVAQTPRSSGLCSHTIESGEPCVVEDAQADPRFSSHLLVAADPQVRFYCGVPVVTTDGYAIGTIAVMDRVARPWRETECLALQRLARQAAALLELRMLRGDQPAFGEKPVQDQEMFQLMAGSSRSTGLDFLQELVDTLAHSIGVAYAFCIRPVPGRRAKTVAGYGPDGPLDTMEYDLVGTPCEHVLREGFCHYPGAVQAAFPQDDLLRQLSIESYMALTLPSPTGEPIGWIAMLAKTPLVDAGRAESLLRMAAGRAGSELGRHLAEQQLRKSEERFRAAYRNATVGMSIADLSGRIEEVNQRLCTILGYSEEELLTRTFQSLTHPDDLGQNLERIKNLMEGTAEGDVFEKRYIRKDGEIVWAQVGLSVIRDAAGRVRHTLAMVQDITERKRTKEALYLAKYTIDHATEAIYWVGAGAELLDVNDAACDMLGYTKDEFRRMTVHDINPEFEADRWPSFWADMRRRGRDSFESLHRAKDGRLIPIEVSVMFIQYNQVECHCAFVRDISERKQAEQALAHTQEKLRQALRASGTGLWDWNTETNEVFFSDEWAQQLGHTNQEIAGRFEEWESRLHPDDRERALVYVQHYLTNPKGPYEQEFRLRRKDGSYCWISARASFVEEPDGRRVRLLGSHTDLTERKLAETALRASEERFHITIEAINEGMWDWNILTDVVYFSPQWIRLLGYVPEAVTGSAAFFYSILHPDDLPRMREVLQAHLDGRTPLKELEVRLHHKSGEYRWYLDRGKVVARDEQGRPLRMVGTITDITERKQVERERAEALGNLQTIMETVPDVIFVLDLEGRLSKWNRRLETVTGYTHDELLGKPALEMVPSAEAEQTSAAIRLAFDNGYAELEGHLLTKDGRALRYHWNGAPFADLQGRVVGISGVGRDITERQQTEALLRSSEERFRLVAQATNDILWDWDLLTGDHWWSPNACEKFGYDPRKEPSIDAWSGRLHPEDRERVLDMVGQAIQTEISTLSAEYRFQLADGTYGYFLNRAHIVRNETGVAVRMIGAMIDVTGPRRAYASLEEAYRRFQAMSQELHMVESNERRRLSRELHDEVGQLLTSLKFDLTSVKRSVAARSTGAGGRGQERLVRALDTTDQLFSRLRRIVRALRPPVLEELGLKAGLEALIADVQARTRLRCVLVFEQAPRRGARQPTLETAFYRIVQELLTNVIRHARATNVSLLVQQSRREWRLTVTDDGVGFDVAGLSPVGGFGLRGIRERVEILAGHVDISSGVDSGTTVQVRIPVGSTSDGTAGAGVSSAATSRRRKPVHE